MKTVRKKLIQFSAAVMTGICFTIYPASAEEPDYSDSRYWSNLCSGLLPLTQSEKNSCAAYMEYMSAQSDALKKQLEEIESQRAAIAENVVYYARQVSGYQAQADSLNGEIYDLNYKIELKQAEIDEKQADIDQREADITVTEEKIQKRMEISQETMRLNQFLDVIMGVRKFSDLIRVINGLSDITGYDEEVMRELAEEIAKLNEDKEELEKAKAELDNAKLDVVTRQNAILALKYQAQIIQEEYRKQSANLEAQGNTIAGDIDNIREMMRSITEKLNQVTASSGWNYPVPGVGINPEAGTWHYASGGVHLGADFAGPLGSTVVAIGNGVVLKSQDGCPYGELGSACGAQNRNGSQGGGNQVYLLTKVNGGLYAIKYLHLLAGTPIATGSIVMAGDPIGSLGSSGNSTGPHCHIEIFFLGSAADFTNYAQTWNGDFSFGCGWGSAALNRLCENGAGAPCRVKPESIYGG